MVCLSIVSLVFSFYCLPIFFFFKQKTAYEMRISDWSSDVCSSDLHHEQGEERAEQHAADDDPADLLAAFGAGAGGDGERHRAEHHGAGGHQDRPQPERRRLDHRRALVLSLVAELVGVLRSEERLVGKECVSKFRSWWSPYH